MSSVGLPVVYSVVGGAELIEATITSDYIKVTALKPGQVTLNAVSDGDEAHNAASETYTFTIPDTKEQQTIEWDQDTEVQVGTSVALTAQSSSGLEISYKITSGSENASIEKDGDSYVLRCVKGGTVTVQAEQAGNDTYKAAEPISKTFTIVKDIQAIIWTLNKTEYYVDDVIELTATASSGLDVSYSISEGGNLVNISLDNDVYKLQCLREGNVTIVASQPGNDAYEAASAVSKIITIKKHPQSITWEQDASLYVGQSLALNATSSAGLAVAYEITNGSDNATIEVDGSGYVLKANKAGTVTVVAKQAGNDKYAAENVSKTFVINNKPVVKQHQTITWNQDIEALAGQTVEMTATASSGLPVTYSYYLAGNGGGWQPSTINGASIYFENSGARIIIASQSGNDEYEAAVSDTMYFNVLDASEADGLMYIDGLYYKYTDDTKTALKVVRGYKSYQGDIVVHSTANGLPVTTLGTHAFYTADRLSSVEVSEGVTNYENEALAHSYNMTKLTLPTTSTILTDWLCSGSRGLKEIHCHATVPYTCTSNVFNMGDDFYEQCVLYVPRGYADAYKATEPWSRFTHIVEEDMPTGIGVISADASDGYWYTLTGIRLSKKPVKEGVYIHCGKKVIIKK